MRAGEAAGEEETTRRGLLRRCWAVTRSMNWFLDLLLDYVMGDVVQVEYEGFKKQLDRLDTVEGRLNEPGKVLDLNTLRQTHSDYLVRVYNGCLLSNSTISATIFSILTCCIRLSGQLRNWGGDVLPPLLQSGLDAGREAGVRWKKIQGIEKVRCSSEPPSLGLMVILGVQRAT